MSKMPVPNENNPPNWPEDLAAFGNLHVYLEKVREGEPDGDFIESVFSILVNSMNPSAAIWWQPTEGGLRWKGSQFIQIDDTHAQCPYTNDVVACAESVIREEEPDIFVCDNPLPESATRHSSDHIVSLVTGCKQLLLPLRSHEGVVAVFTFFDRTSSWTIEALAALQEQIEWVILPKSTPLPLASADPSTDDKSADSSANASGGDEAKDDAQILREMREAARAAQNEASRRTNDPYKGEAARSNPGLGASVIPSFKPENSAQHAELARGIQKPLDSENKSIPDPRLPKSADPSERISAERDSQRKQQPSPKPAPLPARQDSFAHPAASSLQADDEIDALSESEELRLQRMAAAAVAIIGRSLDETECCFDIANELDNLVDADRVTVCLSKGDRCKVKAISNQPVFDSRSAHVKAIEELATFAAKSKSSIWHPQDAESLPESIANKFDSFYELSDGQSVALVPLVKRQKRKHDPEELSSILGSANAYSDRVVGAVIVEGLARPVSRIRTERIFKLVGDPIVNALSNASEHSSLFMMPVWRSLGRFKDLFIGHNRRKAISITAAIFLAIAALFAVPSDLKLRSEGTIQPRNRANVFASTSGVIDEILAEDGQRVKTGQVLLRLSDPALAAELAKVEGTLREAEERLRTNKLQRMRGKFESDEQRKASVLEAAGLQASLDNLRKQHSLLTEKMDDLVIRSPMDGMVISWDTERKLINRPVETGQKLLAVAESDGEWELELKLADQRSGYLRSIWPDSQRTIDESTLPKATYVMASEPTKVYTGRVRDWSRRADVDEELGNVVRVYVDANGLADGLTDSLRPGTEVIAHIHVGRRSLGYCKLFEFFDWVQRVWFKYV